ncbi:MAG: hypothetical protein HS104_31910 [Polyangiaceae bacterium]|nr:hypothetical protein [Polyangiaceae bacterium]MCL4749092.1 hypothetical protein [Myxococcales bacterium]
MRQPLLSCATVGLLVAHACAGARETGSHASPTLTPRTEGSVDASPGEAPAVVDASAGVGGDSARDDGAAAPSRDQGPGAEADAPPVELEPERPPEKLRYRPVGACVDPVADVERRVRPGGTHRKQTDDHDGPRVVIRRDLDGDEQDDQVLLGQPTLGGAHFVYVMRGPCGHYAGRIDTRVRLEVVGGYSKGLRALGGFFPCLPHCCEHLMYNEYRYDGVRYRRAVAESRKYRDCHRP